MTKEDIIRMAREAGLWEIRHSVEMAIGGVGELERFAALVIANNPPQSFMTWQEGYEAGKQTEREACARLCDEHAKVYASLDQNPTTKSAWAACIDNRDAIRVRGQE